VQCTDIAGRTDPGIGATIPVDLRRARGVKFKLTAAAPPDKSLTNSAFIAHARIRTRRLTPKGAWTRLEVGRLISDSLDRAQNNHVKYLFCAKMPGVVNKQY
jgi:hypothetical protein